MVKYDETDGLFISDPDSIPLSYLPSPAGVREAARELILSASGWRKVFTENGDEESFSETPPPEDIVLATTAARAISEIFIEELSRTAPASAGNAPSSDTASAGEDSPAVAVAVDSRPTGPALADAICRCLISRGIALRYLFISPAPEVMSYVKTNPALHGFIYISASHNPVGHNGLKFGLSDGVVAGGEVSRRAIDAFQRLIADEGVVEQARDALSSGSGDEYLRALENIPRWKAEASEAYRRFTLRVAAGSNEADEIDTFSTRLRRALEKQPVGILAELNGSARCRSIEGDLLQSIGARYASENDHARKIVHPIVPEGKNLDFCKTMLLEHRTEDPAYLFAYVPDNDGDRGNIVFYDEEEETAKAIEAQAVFGLSVLSELADLRSRVDASAPAAVVVNGPTSMRIEGIAQIFSVEVYRTETGEANVVSKAKELRSMGYTVRILGEGSNGGNITHPATVRDPLNTVISLLKLLTLPRPFDLWCEKTGFRRHNTKESTGRITIRELLSSLPPFVTTGAYESDAKLQVSTEDHGLLKRRYEELFRQEWEERKEELRHSYGIAMWREINYEGTEAKEGFGPSYRSGNERGGLKIVFSDADGRDSDFLWMRGSGTEPVFRVLVDCRGDDRNRHDALLRWHRSLIERADSLSVQGNSKITDF